MMELIKQKFVKINIIFIVLVLYFSSCQEIVRDGKLECILNAAEVDMNEVAIMVGQVDGWTDTTSLISILYHKKSINISIVSNLKGHYKGKDIYFYQSNVDTLDKRTYDRIPNNIRWKKFTPKEIDKSVIQPPYDPINIQMEYNIKKACIVKVIRGKGFINETILSTCKCE